MPHVPDHQTDHDPRLIAAFAAGDAEGADLDRAQALVARCDDCAALHHDLRSIAAAMPALPAPARPRDFRLTEEQAASVRPTGWRRFLAPLAAPRFAFAAPLGGSLAALGLAGILVAGAASTPIAGTGVGAGREHGPATGADPGPSTSVTADVDLAAPSAAPAFRAAPTGEIKVAAGTGGGSEPAASRIPADAVAPAPLPTAALHEPDIAGGSMSITKSAPDGAAVDEQASARVVPATAPFDATPLPVLAATLIGAGVLLVAGRFVARRLA